MSRNLASGLDRPSVLPLEPAVDLGLAAFERRMSLGDGLLLEGSPSSGGFGLADQAPTVPISTAF